MTARRARPKVKKQTSSTGRLPDPRKGGSMKVVDRRAKFARLSRLTPGNPEAERAFIEGKLEMIGNDPRLSDEEKARAIARLKRRRGVSRTRRE
jgi:hypothetical protein